MELTYYLFDIKRNAILTSLDEAANLEDLHSVRTIVFVFKDTHLLFVSVVGLAEGRSVHNGSAVSRRNLPTKLCIKYSSALGPASTSSSDDDNNDTDDSFCHVLAEDYQTTYLPS